MLRVFFLLFIAICKYLRDINADNLRVVLKNVSSGVFLYAFIQVDYMCCMFLHLEVNLN